MKSNAGATRQTTHATASGFESMAKQRKAELERLGLESDFSFGKGIDSPPWRDHEPFEALLDASGEVWLCSLHKLEKVSAVEALKWRVRVDQRSTGETTGDFSGCVKAAIREFERLEEFARASYRGQVTSSAI